MYFNELPIPKDIRWRRLLSIALFLGLLYAFRKLAPVLIIFVVFARTLGWASDRLFERTRLNRKHSIAGILALFLGGVGVGVFFFVQRAMAFYNMVRTDGGSYIVSLANSTAFVQIKNKLGWDTSELTEKAKDVSLTAVGYLTEGAYIGLFLFIGFVVAIIYLFEREDMDKWLEHVDAKSIQGVMVRWLGYVADSIAITVRLQVVVALFDAIATLPVILLMDLPNPALLFVLVLFSAMIPVVGGFLSGIVLCVVSYDSHGFAGVAVFLAVAFFLGKVESYYLAPRLTASHVKMPALVLVISLLMFEQIFGFWGLFLSFPALYVASKISGEWKREDQDVKDAVEAARTQSNPPAIMTPLPAAVATPLAVVAGVTATPAPSGVGVIGSASTMPPASTRSPERRSSEPMAESAAPTSGEA